MVRARMCVPTVLGKDDVQGMCHELQRYCSLPMPNLIYWNKPTSHQTVHLCDKCPLWVYKLKLGLFACDGRLKIVVASTT